MDSWTNVKTSKCVYHLKDNYTQMLRNTNYDIDHHEKKSGEKTTRSLC